MAEIQQSGFGQLDRLLELVRRTRELLDVLAGEGELPDGGADYLAERTLPHLEGVQAGFHGWLRSESAPLAELQYLLRQVGALRVGQAASEAERRAAEAEAAVERALAERDRDERGMTADGRPRPGQLVRADPWNLAALAHARLVLAYLPRLPDEAVRFPGPLRTYVDIPTPRGPAELAARLAEIEAQLWRAAIGRPVPPVDPAFRRTYGFFDAADRLGLRAFRPAA